jgi:thymidine phosphorylase
VHLPRAGNIGRIDARALGLAIIALGGGRTHPTAAIDHAVGLSEVLGLGDRADTERPFAIVHARTEADLEAAARAIEAAVTVVDEAASRDAVVLETVAPGRLPGPESA